MATQREVRTRTGRGAEHVHDPHRATSAGLLLAALGVVVLNVSPFLDWLKTDDNAAGPEIQRTGYESDSLVPFMAFLGAGLLLAMLYAAARNMHGQHRALTLASMGVGIAVAAQCTAYAIEPMGALERTDDLVPQIGVFVGIVGAVLWAVGCGLMIKAGEDHHHTDHAWQASRPTVSSTAAGSRERSREGSSESLRENERPPGTWTDRGV